MRKFPKFDAYYHNKRFHLPLWIHNANVRLLSKYIADKAKVVPKMAHTNWLSPIQQKSVSSNVLLRNGCLTFEPQSNGTKQNHIKENKQKWCKYNSVKCSKNCLLNHISNQKNIAWRGFESKNTQVFRSTSGEFHNKSKF